MPIRMCSLIMLFIYHKGMYSSVVSRFVGQLSRICVTVNLTDEKTTYQRWGSNPRGNNPTRS